MCQERLLYASSMTQTHLQRINYLSLHIELTPMKKNTVIIGAIDCCWNKTQNTLRNQSVKSLYPNKIKKLFLLKDTLTNTNSDLSSICGKLYQN